MPTQAIARLKATSAMDSDEREKQRLKKYIKDTSDRIAKYKDWNTTGQYDKKLKDMRLKLDEARKKLKAMK